MDKYSFPKLTASEAKLIEANTVAPRTKAWFGAEERQQILSAYNKGEQRLVLNGREFWIRRAGKDLIVGPIVGLAPHCRLNLEGLRHD